MNTTDSAAILEAIHQGGLAKRDINPQPARPSRAPGGTEGYGSLQGCLWLGRSQHFERCVFGRIPRGEFGSEGPCSPEMCIPKEDTTWSLAIFVPHPVPLLEKDDLFFKRKGKI